MAQLSPKEQMAFHAYSVRYRAALKKKHPFSAKSMEIVKNAVREEYEREKSADRSPSTPLASTKEKEPLEPDRE